MGSKYSIILSIMLIFVGIGYFLVYLVDKPFEFEQFNSEEEAISYFDKNYPLGSDIDILLKDFKNSGSECDIITQDETKKDFTYEKIYFCTYFTGWVSLKPLIHFDITTFINKKGEIVNRFVSRHDARRF